VLSRWYDWLYRIVKWFRVPIPWVFGTHPELSELVESGRIRPGRAIDLGCGTGREVIYLAQNGFESTGVDISPTAIAMARKAAEAAGADADFIVDDLTNLEDVTGTFDLIVDYGALNDFNPGQRNAYMSQVLPLAAAGSQLFLMCFDNRLPYEEIRKRFGEEFEIEKVSSKGEAGTRRTFSFYLMHKKGPPREVSDVYP
jgi:cyclopropane fatty-acyl-phospholipid synthase-like methyltransferase